MLAASPPGRLPRARQSATPVIGYLSGESPGPLAPLAATFREGPKDAGYAEDRTVAIEYRSAEEVFLTARIGGIPYGAYRLIFRSVISR